ncbi:PepSY domain-containing protein [Alteribacillus iranensis]|uniref:Uncharacterized membrane protein YkoI n=1 Tax=Alteribacillus iranensis TaxID=930128 RepID=A0A1I2D2U4_9BACI|nr:PepSY domain-containing protein [Alteribacillus iranensis]SFE74838.1 Uncharacterized membrane protein YkoI [Alteribacillus iranensis]
MKKFVIATACVLSLGLVAIGVQQFTASAGDTELSLDEAKSIASEQYPGKVTEVELETKNGKKIYEVEITGDTYKYELKLDATTGEIIRLDEKEKIEKEPNTNPSSNDTTKQQENKDGDDNGKAEPQANNVAIDMKKAQDIALSETGGTIMEAELDEDDGRTYYEFEINTDKGEAEVEVDAFTGEIILISYDD